MLLLNICSMNQAKTNTENTCIDILNEYWKCYRFKHTQIHRGKKRFQRKNKGKNMAIKKKKIIKTVYCIYLNLTLSLNMSLPNSLHRKARKWICSLFQVNWNEKKKEQQQIKSKKKNDKIEFLPTIISDRTITFFLLFATYMPSQKNFLEKILIKIEGLHLLIILALKKQLDFTICVFVYLLF